MRWNTEDAFVGTVDTMVPGRPPQGETDNRTLVFPHFLATPLLPSGSQYREVKFSGNADIGDNTDTVGEAVDAYAHHIVVDSFGDVLFADLQGKKPSSFSKHFRIHVNIITGIIGPDDSVVLFDPQAHTT